MPEIALLPVLVATAAAFLISSTWYALFGAHSRPGSGSDPMASRPPTWKLGVEVLRSLVLALVLAGLAFQCDAVGWSAGVFLGTSLWIGFPLVLWVGAMIWEGTPLRLAAVHAGEWLVKLLAIAILVCTWR